VPHSNFRVLPFSEKDSSRANRLLPLEALWGNYHWRLILMQNRMEGLHREMQDRGDGLQYQLTETLWDLARV